MIWWLLHLLGYELHRICYLGHRGIPSGCHWFWVKS